MKKLKLVILFFISASAISVAQEPMKEKQGKNTNQSKKSSVAAEPKLAVMEKITIQDNKNSEDSLEGQPQLQPMEAVRKQPE